MRKGIVMEVNDPYLTLLTPEGEFLRARKMDKIYTVGEEIDFFPVSGYKEGKNRITFINLFKQRKALISLAVLLVCLGSILPVYQSNKAYAYMSIDASTSIEMGLNKNMQVVELKGFNKDANNVISQLEDWEKKDAAELTSIILVVLKEEGYLAKEQPVIISTVKTNQLEDEAATKFKKNFDKIKQKADKKQVQVKMYTTTQAELEKALDSGVPVGKYHRNKNASAKSKQKKEKSENLTTSEAPETSADTSLPPGQLKKQEQTNSSPANDKQQADNSKSVIPEQQMNGKQASAGNNNEANKGSEKRNSQAEKQKENNKKSNQDKQKTNNHNKSKK